MKRITFDGVFSAEASTGTVFEDIWTNTVDGAEQNISSVLFSATATAKLKSVAVESSAVSGVADAAKDAVVIYGIEGGVYVGVSDSNVEIYNVYGRQVANIPACDGRIIATPAGVMIVKTGEKVIKVIVK